MSEEKNLPRISFAEGYFILILNIVVDLFELFAFLMEPVAAIPYVGIVLFAIFWGGKFFAAFATWGITQLWLIMKGVRSQWYAVGGITDMLFGLLALDVPFGKTIAAAINIYKVNKQAEQSEKKSGNVLRFPKKPAQKNAGTTVPYIREYQEAA